MYIHQLSIISLSIVLNNNKNHSKRIMHEYVSYSLFCLWIFVIYHVLIKENVLKKIKRYRYICMYVYIDIYSDILRHIWNKYCNFFLTKDFTRTIIERPNIKDYLLYLVNVHTHIFINRWPYRLTNTCTLLWTHIQIVYYWVPVLDLFWKTTIN